MSAPKMTSRQVVDALRADYGLAADPDLVQDEWSLLTEVPVCVRYPAPQPGTYRRLNQRILDVLLIRNWRSGQRYDRLAIEIKVSRSDFANETDLKREPAEAVANRCAYAAPAGLLRPEEMPPGWGLLAIHPEPVRDLAPTARGFGRYGQWVRTPTRRTPTVDLDEFLATVARRASRAEERIRRADTDATRLAALDVENRRLRARLDAADARIDRARDRASDAVHRLHATEPQDCKDCEQPVKATFKGHGLRWVHRDPAQEITCRQAREAAYIAEREARTGSRYLYGWGAGPVMTKAEAAIIATDAEYEAALQARQTAEEEIDRAAVTTPRTATD